MHVLHRIARVLALVLLLGAAGRSSADGLRLTGSVGVGDSYGHTYYTLGGRVGYDVAFGITPEVSLTFFRGATPTFVQLAPGLTWYVPLPFIRPYVGGFYAHEFVGDGFPDEDALGVRGGIGLLGLGPVSLNIGAAYERRLSCSASCDAWWPEASAGFGF